MKKVYIQPQATMAENVDDVMLCSSNGVYADDLGIVYGGVDEDGQKDPDARQQDLWEDE